MRRLSTRATALPDRARRSRTTSASCGRCSTSSTPACSAASDEFTAAVPRSRSRSAATRCGSRRCAIACGRSSCAARRTRSRPSCPRKTQLVRAVELGGAQRELYESIRVAAHADVRQHIRKRGLAGSHDRDPRRAAQAAPGVLRSAAGLASTPRATSRAARSSTCCSSCSTQQLADGRRILVFSQFARMLGLISEALLARGIRPRRRSPATRRIARSRSTRSSRARADVFLISLKAGGTGLNLDRRRHRDPLRPVVEPGGAGAGDRSRAPHRPDQAGVRARPDRRGLRRGAHAVAAAAQAPARRRDPRSRQRRRGALTERDVDDLLAPLAT